jgi:hypothetical protein
MSIWRQLQPLHLVLPAADVVAGSGMVLLSYRYLDWRFLFSIPLLVLSAAALFSAIQLWEACFPEKRLKDESPPGTAHQDEDIPITRPFLAACGLSILGLFLPMFVGCLSVNIAFLVLVFGIFYAHSGRRNSYSDSFLKGLLRGGSLYLGMSIYPGLEFAGPPPLLAMPILFLGLHIFLIRLTLRTDKQEDLKSVAAVSIAATLILMFAALAILILMFAALAIMPYSKIAYGVGIFAILIVLRSGIRLYGEPITQHIYQYWVMTTSTLILMEGAWVAALGRNDNLRWRALFLMPLFVAFLLALIRIIEPARPEEA